MTLSLCYGTPTEVVGGELPLFDIKAMNTRFDDVIDSRYAGANLVAPDEFLAIGRQISQLNKVGTKKGFTTFNGLKELRKNINTTPRRLLKELKDDVDRMMDPSSYGSSGNLKLTGVGGPKNATKVKDAMKLLQNARASYRTEIKLFGRLETLGIIKNLGDSGANVKLTAGNLFDRITDSSPDFSKKLS